MQPKRSDPARSTLPAVLAALSLALPGTADAAWAAVFQSAAPVALVRAGNGMRVMPEAIETALAEDNVVWAAEAGDRIRIADLELVADEGGRAMLALSSEFLTVAVTSGRLRFHNGAAAGPGQVLLVALDGTRIQRLAFSAARLSASLSPGARPLLAADLERLIGAQRRGAFWGRYEPLRVNARAPGPAAAEAIRTSYLSDPAIVRQRRAAVGQASAEARGRIAADAFLAAFASGDAGAVAALLDPEPFLARGGVPAVEDGRRRAAEALLADGALRSSLAGARIAGIEPDGSSAVLESGGGRWRLAIVPRDRALFIASLEPAS